jgi:hypothetical protein
MAVLRKCNWGLMGRKEDIVSLLVAPVGSCICFAEGMSSVANWRLDEASVRLRRGLAAGLRTSIGGGAELCRVGCRLSSTRRICKRIGLARID